MRVHTEVSLTVGACMGNGTRVVLPVQLKHFVRVYSCNVDEVEEHTPPVLPGPSQDPVCRHMLVKTVDATHHLVVVTTTLRLPDLQLLVCTIDLGIPSNHIVIRASVNSR